MGAYNTLTFPWVDANTKEEYELTVQFKYGQVWQDHYSLGDKLNWGANNEGEPGAQQVLVEAILDGVKQVESIPEDFEIYIVNNIITDVKPLENSKKFFSAGKNYIILK
jgi:hypothetical protein